MIHRLRLLLLLMMLLALGGGRVACAAGGGVVVVMSEQSSGYTEVRDGLLAELERSGLSRTDVQVLLASDVSALDGALPVRPRLYIALGTAALRQLMLRDLRAPVMAALIPRAGFDRVMGEQTRKPPSTVSVLYLDQPYGRQLDLLRLALPSATTIGVVWGPESVLQQRLLTGAMTGRGLDLLSTTVGADGSLVNSLKTISDDADVLLAVADPQVFNSSTIANILLATYRAHIPVVAFSPAYVRAGALMSLHSTPAQIAVQAAAMSRALLQGTGSGIAQYPHDFVVSVNEHVARSLGIAVDGPALTERLLRGERRP